MPTADVGFPDSEGLAGRATLVSYGPTLFVQIGFDAQYTPAGHRQLDLPSQQLPALVDTGAFASCIDSSLALALNLPIVNRQEVAGVHGSQEVDVHFCQIYVPDLNYTLYGESYAVRIRCGSQPHLAPIGRDFLQHFTMLYEGRTGRVTISND